MASIRVELEYADGNFTSGMARANSTLQRFEQQTGRTIVGIKAVGEASQSLLGTMRDVTAVLGLAGAAFHNLHAISTGIVGDVIKVNAEFQKLTTLLKGMSQSADPLKEAQTQVKQIRDFAKEVPFSIGAISDSFVKMKATGIDPMKGALRGLTDGIAAMGGSDDQLKRATLAITQMSGKGVIQMEELRQQLGEAMPRAVELMARSMGIGMGQLIKEIATGTVSAKEALEGLSDEMSRTFGGAAKDQMQTFIGQVTVLKTNMQTIALGVGEGGSFFDNITKSLTDLNGMLSGNAAKVISTDIGEALNSVLAALQTGIMKIVEFRNEIARFGTILAYAIGGSLVLGAIRSMTAYVGQTAAAWAMVTANAQAASRAMTANNMIAAARNPLAPALGGMTAVTGGAAQMGAAVRNAGTTLAFLGSTVMTMAPYLAVFGLAAYGIAEAFGLIGNKAREAYEEITKYGATSQKQIDLAREDLKAKQDQLAALNKLIEAEAARSTARDRNAPITLRNMGRGTQAPETAGLAEEAAKRARSAEEQAKNIAKIQAKFDEEQAAEKARNAVEVVDRELRESKKKYDVEGILAKDAYEIQRKEYALAKRATDLIDKDFQDQTKARALAVHVQAIELLEARKRQAEEIAKSVDKVESDAALRTIEQLDERIKREKELEERARARVMGANKAAKVVDSEELFKKGESFLDKIKADIAGAKGAFQGLDAEVIALNEALKQGRFGDTMIPRVKELVAEIVKAKEEANDLNKIVAGGQKMEAEADAMLMKAKEKLFELQLKAAGKEDATDSEKFELRKASGMFPGWGQASTAAQQKLIDMRRAMQSFGDASKDTGKILLNETFGGGLMSAAGTFLAVLEKIGGVMSGLRNGNPLSSLFGGAGGNETIGGMTSTGMSGDDFEKYRNAIAGIESNPTPGKGYDMFGQWITKKNGMRDQALGRYQIMRSNLPQWSEEAMGKEMSAAEFMSDPKAQDMIFNYQFGKLMKKHGSAQHAAHAWLTGQPIGKSNAADANGTNGTMYVNKFNGFLAKQGMIGSTPTGDETGYGQTGAKIAELKGVEAEIRKLAPGIALADMMKKVQREIEAVQEQAAEEGAKIGKREAAMKSLIKKGDFNNGVADSPEAAKYKELLELARKQDEAEEALAKKKKDRAADVAAKEKLMDMTRDQKQRLDDANKLAMNPDMAEATKAMQAKRAIYDEILEKIAQVHGIESAYYKEQKALVDANMQSMTREQSLKAQASTELETRRINRSVLPEQQMKRAAFEEDMRQKYEELRIDQLVGDEKIRAYEKYYAYRKAKEAELNGSGALAQLGKQWEDLGKNMEQSMANAFSSVTDGIAGMLTGQKVNFQQILQNFAKDMIKNVLNAALAPMMKSMSGMFSGMMGGGGAKGGGAGKFGGGAAKGGAAMTGLGGFFHTGGIVGGAAPMTKMIDYSVFAGAPKFHTGGVIGADEVPIIAKRGEGVFTPAQMEAMGGMGGGGRVVQLQNNVTVNANGGTKEQNDDLSNKISKQVEAQARAMVVDEMRRQMRPGNMLNQN